MKAAKTLTYGILLVLIINMGCSKKEIQKQATPNSKPLEPIYQGVKWIDKKNNISIYYKPFNFKKVSKGKKEFAVLICEEGSYKNLLINFLERYNVSRFEIDPESKECIEFRLNILKSNGFHPVTLFKESKIIKQCGTSVELENTITKYYNKRNLYLNDEIRKKVLKENTPKFLVKYKNLKEIVNNDLSYVDNGNTVVDFYAIWCGPCGKYSPQFEKTMEKYPDVKCARVNVDNNKELAKKYVDRGIPCTIFFRNGKEVDMFVGYLEGWEKTELETRIKKHYFPSWIQRIFDKYK